MTAPARDAPAATALPDSEADDILRDLEREIRLHRLALGRQGPLAQSDALARVREGQWVNPHLPIGWPAMPKGLFAKLQAYTKKIARRLLRWYINPLVEQQNAYNRAVAEALDELVVSIHEHLEARDSHSRSDRETVALRLARLEQRLPALTIQPERRLTQGAPALSPALDTFLLGLVHRGPTVMLERVGDYDDLWAALVAQGSGEATMAPVLELGAGRGDLVVHLREMGLPADGVESDADAAQWAQSQGRDVRLADPLEHLDALPDGSLGAIVAIQWVEHLSMPDIAHLLRLVAAKLRRGGILVLETLNPTCLTALTQAYLLDPTHRTPLHPETARFLAEQASLQVSEVRFLRPVPAASRLATVHPESGAWAESLNANVERLNALLYGAQDYALIAYRPEN
jgi:2-polyprenyl-3-methyl-5-hydroxy-6-metoxy-1,4-benzoquinol methylase